MEKPCKTRSIFSCAYMINEVGRSPDGKTTAERLLGGGSVASVNISPWIDIE